MVVTFPFLCPSARSLPSNVSFIESQIMFDVVDSGRHATYLLRRKGKLSGKNALTPSKSLINYTAPDKRKKSLWFGKNFSLLLFVNDEKNSFTDLCSRHDCLGRTPCQARTNPMINGGDLNYLVCRWGNWIIHRS